MIFSFLGVLRIEMFYSQGSHGKQCVLRTLCETGQRQEDKEPGSMVVELLRAVFTYFIFSLSLFILALICRIIRQIFFLLLFDFIRCSLPATSEPVSDPRHVDYDRAHQTMENCQKLFPECKASIWNSKFNY